MKKWNGQLACLRPVGWKSVEAGENTAVPETRVKALPAARGMEIPKMEGQPFCFFISWALAYGSYSFLAEQVMCCLSSKMAHTIHHLLLVPLLKFCTWVPYVWGSYQRPCGVRSCQKGSIHTFIWAAVLSISTDQVSPLCPG